MVISNFLVTAMFGLLSKANSQIMDEAFQFAQCNHHFVASGVAEECRFNPCWTHAPFLDKTRVLGSSRLAL